jgi:stage III sporulation protein AD
MDIIIKIVAIGLITSFATLIIKPIRSDFAILTAIAGGFVIIFLIMSYLTSVFQSLKGVISFTGLDGNLYTLLLKIVGVGYLIEFTAGICADTGNASLGDKVLLGGKIIILVMAFPIITNILEIIMGILPK